MKKHFNNQDGGRRNPIPHFFRVNKKYIRLKKH